MTLDLQELCAELEALRASCEYAMGHGDGVGDHAASA
jgi:hypothetical protein